MPRESNRKRTIGGIGSDVDGFTPLHADILVLSLPVSIVTLIDNLFF